MLLHICTLRQCPYNSTQITKRSESSHSIVKRRQHTKMYSTKLHKMSTTITLQNEHTESEQMLAGTFYPLIMDSVYSSLDEEFADVHFVESLLLPKSSRAA